MAESKFTPGPWGVSPGFGVARWKAIGAKGTQLAIVGNASMCLVQAEVEANAALMAEAPRLLEVLRKVLTYAETSTRRQYLDEADQTFVEANALLEKHGG